ncbi:MAG: response regulator [Erythrobacter sp.]|nr:response regulator [Erythrobacter sp.]
MLIEDEPNIAEALCFILSRDGWRVTNVQDGARAVEVLHAVNPDLVILDVMLPGVGGFDILDAIRADPQTAGLPVMILSAKGQGRDREAAKRAGADLFMAKPFSNAEMLAQARALVAK